VCCRRVVVPSYAAKEVSSSARFWGPRACSNQAEKLGRADDSLHPFCIYRYWYSMSLLTVLNCSPVPVLFNHNELDQTRPASTSIEFEAACLQRPCGSTALDSGVGAPGHDIPDYRTATPPYPKDPAVAGLLQKRRGGVTFCFPTNISNSP
jgi:hypothetical protein